MYAIRSYYALFIILEKTTLGVAVRATASNPQTARLQGIPVKLVSYNFV